MKWQYTLLIIIGILIIFGIGIFLFKIESVKSDLINPIYQSFFNQFSIPVSSGYYDGTFTYELTGNESKWVSEVKFSGREVVIIPKENITDRTYNECTEYDTSKGEAESKCLIEKNVTYNIPSILPVNKLTSDKIIEEKLTDVSKVVDNKTSKESFTYQIPNDVHYLKIGDSSIVITELQVTTQSNLVNVTAETGKSNHTHLTVNTANAPYDSLVGYWNFDGDAENTKLTTAYDWSGKGNDGTYVGDASANTTCGKYGEGACFDGDGDYVDMGDMGNTEGVTQLAISLWVKSNENIPSVTKGVISKTNTFSLNWDTSQDVGFYIIDNSYNVKFGAYTNGITDTNWHHVVGVYNGSLVFVYVDGILGNTRQDCTGSTGSNSNTVKISGTTTASLNGSIDDVMIFNRSLSSDEIKSIYNATKYQHTQNLSDGAHTFKAYTQDLGGNMNMNGTIYFNVSTVVADTIYPSFSEYYDDNATLLDSGTGHFNVTVKNTNGTVYLWINNTKIYATNLSADNYNVSYTFTHGGNYMYNWTAYGNGTSHNQNISNNFWYTVNESAVADTCSYTSGNWNVNCADYCNITSNVNGGGIGNNFTAIGVGWFKMSANIFGFKNYKFGGGCNATCTSTGCIRI